MDFIYNSCEEFCNLLASSASVPGGGGACAMIGAFGAALGNMVGNLTIGKKKYAQVEDEIKTLMKRMEELQEELIKSVQEDAKAFEPLSKAYSIKAETNDEKEAKDKIMEEALKTACEPPLHVIELCTEAIPMMMTFAEKGSVLAVSDAGVGALFCKAAAQGAYLNVIINTKLMKDRVYAGKKEHLATELRDRAVKEAEEIYAYVCKRLL